MKNFEQKDTSFKVRNSLYVQFYQKKQTNQQTTLDNSPVGNDLLFYSQASVKQRLNQAVSSLIVLLKTTTYPLQISFFSWKCFRCFFLHYLTHKWPRTTLVSWDTLCQQVQGRRFCPSAQYTSIFSVLKLSLEIYIE